jgi:hypothetical protein
MNSFLRTMSPVLEEQQGKSPGDPSSLDNTLDERQGRPLDAQMF